MTPTVGAVVLTMGNRPTELAAAIDSLLSQEDVQLDVVVVGNGWRPQGLPPTVKSHELAQNVGIPAGRNAGVPQVSGDYLLFLDDDALLPNRHTLSRLLLELESHPGVSMVQPGVVDPTGLPSPKRWVPRPRAGDPTRPSVATSLWEGVLLIRRSVFDEIGGWGAPYFYAHEGIELCWRVWAHGDVVWYAGNVPVHHPAINPLRHEDFWYKNARNRVWLARRNLPLLLVPVYPTVWIVRTLTKTRNPAYLKSWLHGWIDGWRQNPGGRKAMSWRTVWRLTLAGRPPIV